jgi:DNA-binding NtrC family response regulator
LITSEHLALTPPAIQEPVAEAADAGHSEAPVPAPAGGDIQSVERTMIEQALQNARFNKSKAAKELGLTRTQLYVRMRRYGLS